MGSPTPPLATEELTRQELRLRRVLLVLGVVLGAFVIQYLLEGLIGGAEYPFVANSVAKDALFSMLCFVAAADVRRFSWAVYVIVIGHVLLILSLLAMLIAGDTSSIAATLPSIGLPMPDAGTYIWIWLALATAVTAALIALHHSAVSSRHPLQYLSQTEHRTLTALAEVLVMDEDDVVTPEQVADRVDEYLAMVEAREKWKAKLALVALTVYPLLRLRPPYPIMSPQRRLRFIERCFINDVAERRLPGPLRRPLQSALIAAQQLCFMGYYGDPRTGAECGYVPFTRRPTYAAGMKTVRRPSPALAVTAGDELEGDRLEADVVVVGSGAAGSIVARRLLERAPDRRVLMLERGRHIDTADFDEDELRQFARLYADGAFQLSRDARFQVLQGRCVGGSTVVNNAVCFRLPREMLGEWNDPVGLDAGLDEGRLAESFDRLERDLPVASQEANPALNPGAPKFIAGVRELGLDRPPAELAVVDANIEDCLGCGYCNYGCPYGKKLSMLDTVLPTLQREHGIEIVSRCRVDHLERRNGGPGELVCELPGKRRLRVSGRTVVIAAGAIASSLILQRSGIGGKSVGRGLGFNVAAPMHAEFDEKLDSYRGLQISHTLRPADEPSLVLETWFNPVGAESLFMPGWFSDHFANMRRYDHMACVGAVVGTRRNGSVRPGRLGRGMVLDWSPAPEDLRTVVRGLKLAGRAFLAAGALKVMTTTFRYLPCKTEAELDRLDEVVRDNTDITLQSSHPQGGNAISRDRTKGVVDPSFRVHDREDLYVCDASVFPSPITVNPQLTVMALADYAGGLIE